MRQKVTGAPRRTGSTCPYYRCRSSTLGWLSGERKLEPGFWEEARPTHEKETQSKGNHLRQAGTEDTGETASRAAPHDTPHIYGLRGSAREGCNNLVQATQRNKGAFLVTFLKTDLGLTCISAATFMKIGSPVVFPKRHRKATRLLKMAFLFLLTTIFSASPWLFPKSITRIWVSMN